MYEPDEWHIASKHRVGLLGRCRLPSGTVTHRQRL